MAGERSQYDDRGQSGSGAGDGARDGLDGSARDDLDGVVLDEAFIRSADASEPSARARMLAARWRREEPEPQPWRSDEPPAGWFFSKARRRLWRRR
ncbi:hypothetical protein AB0I06_27450 [Streptomyces sp. NPDC050674]|uniref:SGM_3592 family protein n=1 Tax=Streptomyces sp. NPDC050674 TaxID=3157216 RepID=UPI003426CEEC